jgi:hypothetical protein
MFASICILTLFLPAAFLPLGLSTFYSPDELEEMGVSLERPEISLPLQGYELVGFLPASNNNGDSDGHVRELSKRSQIFQ